MANEDVDYEICSADSELGNAPELRTKLVVFPEWPNKRGKPTAFLQQELTHGEHEEFELSDRVYDKVGQVTRLKIGGKDYRYLARTTRDGDGQRIWATDEACEKRLKPLGQNITNKLIAAANWCNYGDEDNSSKDEAVADAEGKSGEISDAK